MERIDFTTLDKRICSTMIAVSSATGDHKDVLRNELNTLMQIDASTHYTTEEQIAYLETDGIFISDDIKSIGNEDLMMDKLCEYVSAHTSIICAKSGWFTRWRRKETKMKKFYAESEMVICAIIGRRAKYHNMIHDLYRVAEKRIIGQ